MKVKDDKATLKSVCPFSPWLLAYMFPWETRERGGREGLVDKKQGQIIRAAEVRAYTVSHPGEDRKGEAGQKFSQLDVDL